MGDHKTCVADPGRLFSAPGLVTFIIKKKKIVLSNISKKKKTTNLREVC